MQDFNWDARQIKHSPQFIHMVAEERGVNESTVEGLLKRGLIGEIFIPKWNEPSIAFPIHDENGDVFRAHCRRWKDKEWVYEPYRDPEVRGVTAFGLR